MKRAEEMTPLLETVESQHQASHSFPQALGNLANTARFPHSLSSCDYDCAWKLITLTTGASRTRGLLSYLTQPTPVWVTSLNQEFPQILIADKSKRRSFKRLPWL
jgi:hypothetical protein